MPVKLFALPIAPGDTAAPASDGVTVDPALAYDRDPVAQWITSTFGEAGPGWASECDMALSQLPATCFVGVHDRRPIGFGCYDCRCRGLTGPFGVDPTWQRRGVGRTILFATLADIRAPGYGHAVIGHVGAPAKTASAVLIPASTATRSADRASLASGWASQH